MANTNPVFEEHYDRYLHRLNHVDLSLCATVLGITVDEERKTAQIPFFRTLYRVSRFGVMDDRGKRPDYGTCVVLLKYLLMCPKRVPPDRDWVSPRDFSDAGQAQNAGLSAYTSQAISKRYSGGLVGLKAAVGALGGMAPEVEYPYDISAVFAALPKLPLLFLFNDADEAFPAQATILFQRRAEHILDAECRIMVEWFLLEQLKRAEKAGAA